MIIASASHHINASYRLALAVLSAQLVLRGSTVAVTIDDVEREMSNTGSSLFTTPFNPDGYVFAQKKQRPSKVNGKQKRNPDRWK